MTYEEIEAIKRDFSKERANKYKGDLNKVKQD